jgi:hypothetical protein
MAARQLFGWLFPASLVALGAFAVAVSHRPRPVLFGVLVATVSVVAVLALLELSAALKLVHWRVVCAQWLGCDSPYNLTFVSDPLLGWRRPADARWTERALSDIEGGWSLPPARPAKLTFSYDSLGFRNPATLRQADVALVGDSYVEGSYNDDPDVVARRLAARLAREVANLGIAGFGPKQQLRVIDDIAPRYGAKVVVWVFFEGNDLYDDRTFEGTIAMTPVETAKGMGREGTAAFHGWEARSFALNALALLRRWVDPVFPNQAPFAARLTTPGHVGERVLFVDYAAAPWTDAVAASWADAQATFRRGPALARDRGVQLMLVFAPIKFRVYRAHVDIRASSPMRTWGVWPLREKFAEFCSAEGSACLDLTPALEDALTAGGEPFAATDTHWSAEGHDLVARLVRDEIVRRGWLQ